MLQVAGVTDGVSWLQCAWEENWRHINIAAKEMVPIILAVGTWGHMQWEAPPHPVSIRQHGCSGDPESANK